MRNGRDKRGMAQLNVEVRIEVRERIKEEAEKAGESIGEWLTKRLGYGEVERRVSSLMEIYGNAVQGEEARKRESSGNQREREDASIRKTPTVPSKQKQETKAAVNPLLAVYGVRDGGVRSTSEGIEDICPAAQAVEQEMPGLVSVRGERDSRGGGHDARDPLVDYRVLDLDGETVKCCLKCYRVNGEPGGQCKTCRGLNDC